MKTFRFLMILTALVLATSAQASEPDRTERTAIVGGISAPAGATTTTNFGGQPLDERFQGASAGESSAAAASGATGSATGHGSTSR